jgi:hypothetical protein
MKILVLNSGSSSQKACLYEIGESLPNHPPACLWEGRIEWGGETSATVETNSKGVVQKKHVTVPSLLGRAPAEVIHPHARTPVPANSKLIASAFREKVQAVNRVLEDPSRSEEVFEPARLAGGDGRGANEVEFPVCGHPVDHRRLNERVAINDHYVLGLMRVFGRQILRQQFRIGALFAFGNVSPAINLLGVDSGKHSAVPRSEIHVRQKWAQ